MKTEITEHDRHILSSAYHILQNLDMELCNDYLTDCRVDGAVKFYGMTHKAARCTSNIVDGMSRLFKLLKMYSS